jgi:hypothetical protein
MTVSLVDMVFATAAIEIVISGATVVWSFPEWPLMKSLPELPLM